MTNLYTTCDLPLERYIRLVVDKDLAALIIDPAAELLPSDEDLRQAEIDISSEFSELTGSNKAASLHESISRLCELEAKVLTVKLIVTASRQLPLKQFIDALKADDYGLDLDVNDPVALAADLDRVLIEIKMYEVEILQINAAITEQQQKGGGSTRAALTYQFFEDMLIAFEEMMKVQYEIPGLTLRKYAGLSRRFQQKIKSERNGRRK